MMGCFVLFIFTKLWIFYYVRGGKVTSCSEIFTTRSGMIMSPNYPDFYDHNLNCTWEIRPYNGGRIVLSFHDFYLEPSSTCSYDYIKIYDGTDNETKPLVKKVCSTSMKEKTVISSSDRMVVYFITDYSSSRRGFNITWDTCGGTFTDEDVRITSPQYHFNHSSLVCHFHLVTRKTSAVLVNLSETELGTYTGECLIQVLDSNRRQIGEICNQTNPRIYSSNTNKITLKFNMIYRSSVILNASFTEYECSDTVRDTSGLLQSPEYPTPFERDSICDVDFNITILKNQLLEISFNDLSIQCNGSDVLQFYQYDASDNVSVIDVCTDNTTDILYLENRVLMRFLSTYDGYSSRFSMNYSIIDLQIIFSNSTTVYTLIEM